MKSRIHLMIIAALVYGWAAGNVHAAITVEHVGTDFVSDAVGGWRTASVAKALDLDGDGIYGSTGYLLAATAPGNTGGTFNEEFDTTGQLLDGPLGNGSLVNLANYPPGLTVTNGWLPLNQQIAGFFGTIDNPEGGPDLQQGIIRRSTGPNDPNGIEGQVAVITIGSDTPGAGVSGATMRLGLLLSNFPEARPKAVRVLGTDGQNTSDPFFIENFAGEFSRSAMFWDITDFQAGDKIEVWLDAADDANVVGLSGLTFDIVVPEPGSLALIALGAGLMLSRRR